ncbi:unnamed protein product [Lampetra planeri]
MFTRRKQLTKTSSDDEGIILQTAPGITALEKGREAALQAEQRDDHHTAPSPPSVKERRACRARLASLLQAAAALIAELNLEEPATEVGAPEPREIDATAAASRARETPGVQPAHGAAILVVGRDEDPAKLDLPPNPPIEVLSLKCRLPFAERFSAAGGDWEAFHCRFSANCKLAGWTEVEVLRALPTALDDDALAAFYAIPRTERVTLPKAFAQMAAIYDPPSNVRHKFALRRWREAETPLAFRSALLSLGQAALPKMEQAGLDSLVLERILALAQELDVGGEVTQGDEEGETSGGGPSLAQGVALSSTTTPACRDTSQGDATLHERVSEAWEASRQNSASRQSANERLRGLRVSGNKWAPVQLQHRSPPRPRQPADFQEQLQLARQKECADCHVMGHEKTAPASSAQCSDYLFT